MSTTDLQSLKRLIDAEKFDEAYVLATHWPQHNADDTQWLDALLELSTSLRSCCIGMASRKADMSPDYYHIDNLLSQVIHFTGEDAYGKRIAPPIKP